MVLTVSQMESPAEKHLLFFPSGWGLLGENPTTIGAWEFSNGLPLSSQWMVGDDDG